MIGAYVRVSTSRQGDGESPENQRERLQAAGADEFYLDVVSGYRLSQRRRATEFQRLTADIKVGKLTKLLTIRLDRIARRDAILLELSDLCEQHGVEFLCLQSGRVDTTTAAGWLSVKMQMMMAEHFSRQLSENIRNGLTAQIARGIHTRPGTSLPFHLAPDPASRRGVVPSEAWDDARHVVNQIIAGEWTLSDAARFIDATHGRMKASSSISKWIRSPSILGHLSNSEGKILIAACWPALVTEDEQHQLLTVVAEARKRWGANNRKAMPPKALSGLCTCKYCGGRMAITTSKRGNYASEYLRCYSKIGCSVANRKIPALAIEQMLVIEHVMPRIESMLIATQRETQPMAALTPEKKQWLRELRHRKQTPPEFLMPSDRERINQLEVLIARTSEPIPMQNTPNLAALALKLTNVTLGMESSWFSDQPPARNQNLKALLESITIDADAKRIVCAKFALDSP